MIRASHRRSGIALSRVLLAVVASLLLILLAAFAFVPRALDRRLNRVVGASAPEPSSHARTLFASLRVADLHADPLLWDRDLGERHPYGHVDLPRLLEGNVALQVFGIVTQAPLGQNFESNDADAPDLITLVAALERWPRATWTSKLERVLHQARRLDELAARPPSAPRARRAGSR